MDENELVKTGLEVMLRPATEIAENALGLLGGDWLSEKRTRNRAKLKSKTDEILERRGAKLDTDPSPSVVIPLLMSAQDEGRDELLDLWAALLAAASDPARRKAYRREFVAIAKELEPVDIIVLMEIGREAGRIKDGERSQFTHDHGLNNDQLQV